MTGWASYTPSTLFISEDNSKISVITQSGTIIWDITDCVQQLKNHDPISLSLFKNPSMCTIL